MVALDGFTANIRSMITGYGVEGRAAGKESV
jgi:hypothetical protein